MPFARSIHCRLVLLFAVQLLFAPFIKADVACGTSGFKNFAPDGDDLRAAVSCYVNGTNCATVGGSKAAIQGGYGNNITYWCTGLVTNFNFVFYGMKVRVIPRVSSW